MSIKIKYNFEIHSYRIVKNFGGKKVWGIKIIGSLAEKLAN